MSKHCRLRSDCSKMSSLSKVHTSAIFDVLMHCNTTEIQIKVCIKDNSKIFFLISQQNHVCCDSSLEPSHRDSTNDGSQHMFKGVLWKIIL